MNCPFCAEEIRDAAVVCRFCGAARTGGEWRAPDRPVVTKAPRKGTTLLRSSGVLLVATAAFEAYNWADPVVIAGAVRTGGAAALYHGVMALVYAAAGVGLLGLRRAGYRVALAAIGLVTIDRLAFLLDGVSIQAAVAQGLMGVDGLEQVLDPGDVAAMVRLASWAILAGWWLLGLAIFLARDRFRDAARDDRGEPPRSGS